MVQIIFHKAQKNILKTYYDSMTDISKYKIKNVISESTLIQILKQNTHNLTEKWKAI